jgi:hypothetical protein
MSKTTTAKTPSKRFLSIRLTETEYKEVYRRIERSTCRSLTEYVKKLITAKPVTVKVRNESQDELLQAIIGIKNSLEQLAGTAEGSDDPTRLSEVTEIKSMIQQIAKKWL